MDESRAEFVPFRFHVALLDPAAGERVLCGGAFSEVSGLEATMTPKALREGGRNWGEVQLAGPTTFAPIVLKRGLTGADDLWTWFDVTTRGANYGLRYAGRIDVFPHDRELPGAPRFRWTLHRALPTRFKGPDLSATATQVAIEELHLAHEGLVLERLD
jgi:phage tail-like protein